MRRKENRRQQRTWIFAMPKKAEMPSWNSSSPLAFLILEIGTEALRRQSEQRMQESKFAAPQEQRIDLAIVP
ncbi:MAG: hypothetical protein LBD10_06495 [Desulfobulbus sp.]|uniref:hypothetical protein n=1 Tax=Desulfobulbus sp. TaxID=895 RepID=UPI002850E091|nr:hypothetical protein [Desulfobulbus sp.]MDR2549827.1 hypothetical protein [Desulfobulbus sp.]